MTKINKENTKKYTGTIILKCNTVFIEPDEKVNYDIKYLGDSSKLCGGNRVLFELDEKIYDYVYSARILKVLDNPNNTMENSSDENCKIKVKTRNSMFKNIN